MSDHELPVTVRAFEFMERLDVEGIHSLPDHELRPLLPSLVRMALCVPIDTSNEWMEKKKGILIKLSSTDVANTIVSLLSVDFHALDMDLRKEIAVRSKMGSSSVDSSFHLPSNHGLALEFERSDGARKFRLVLSELISIQAFARMQSVLQSSLATSELFDNDIYLDEVSDVLAIAAAELPASVQLTEVAETLVHIRRGPDVICRLVANFPETFFDVCSTLVMNGDKQDEESIIARNRIKTLRQLCQMNPSRALAIRSLAIEAMRMPGLAVLLTIDYDDSCNSNEESELLIFLNGFFSLTDEKTKQWFIQYLKMGQKKMDQGQHCTIQYARQELLSLLRQLLRVPRGGELPDTRIIKICTLLRLYCVLRGCAQLKFTDEENNVLLSTISCLPPGTAAGIKMVSLSLCLLIVCPSLMSTADSERKAIEWLKLLMKEEKYFGQVSQVKSSFEEMLLLIAIHFHSGQHSAIADLICSTLGVKVQVRGTNFTKLKQLFTRDVFTEETIAAHAIKVPVTPNLSQDISGFLPIHCIFQLLKSRAFSKHQVAIQDWIFKQILQARAPVHPILPSLIEAFVHSCLVPPTKGGRVNEPISPTDIQKIFDIKLYCLSEGILDETVSRTADALTTQLLLLQYLLIYRDIRLNQSKVVGHPINDHYGSELMSRIPVFFLLQEARRREVDYAPLFPTLLKLTTTHFAHLCLVSDWMNPSFSDNVGDIPPDQCKRLSDLMRYEFSNLPNSQREVSKLLNRMLTLSKRSLWSLAQDFVSLLPLLLRDDIPRMILERCKKIWWRLNSVFPDSLWVMTVNAFRSKSSISVGRLTWKDIVHDPLYVLRCDQRVFRCPELLEITLHILNAFLTASRTILHEHLMDKPSKSLEEEKDREDLKVALIAAQESAAVQVLLEICLPTQSGDGLLNPSREVQGLICSHLHHSFIADPNLAKLVHFQTYSSDLLPLTVTGIPSMHICLDFLPELLAQPDLEKQVFAIQLASFLCLQFTIAKSICVARLCFNVANTLISLLPSARRSTFFIPVLPALVRMCRAFPPLADDARLLLQQLKNISLSTLAATSCTFESCDALVRTFSAIKTRFPDKDSFNGSLDTLSPEESLFLVIQKSLDSLDNLRKNTHQTVATLE